MRGFLKIAALGAAAMYYLDPQAGPARRERLAATWDSLCDTLESAGLPALGESGRGTSNHPSGGGIDTVLHEPAPGIVMVDTHGIEQPATKP